MIRQNGQLINLNYLSQTGQIQDDEILYYNLSLVRGLTSFPNNIPAPVASPATFDEINQTEVLKNTSEYYISVMRASIPTIAIPKLIMPVVVGQTNINLMYNSVVFLYRDASGNPIYGHGDNMLFVPEISNVPPVNVNTFSLPHDPMYGQDTNGVYYYIYNVESFVKIINTTLKTVYTTFQSVLSSPPYNITLPPNEIPFFSYNNDTQRFTFYAPKANYLQASYPRVEVYMDGLSIDMINPVANIVGQKDYISNPSVNNKMIALLLVDDLILNTRTINSVDYIVMESEMSPLQSWNGFQKIIFQVGSGISTLPEIDPVPTQFQGSSSQSFQKANLPMLCDFEVDKASWALNSSYIQFVASSITQCRLISIQSNNPIQNFSLSVYWIDNFGIRRLLNLPALNPITVKLAFFKKSLLRNSLN